MATKKTATKKKEDVERITIAVPKSVLDKVREQAGLEERNMSQQIRIVLRDWACANEQD